MSKSISLTIACAVGLISVSVIASELHLNRGTFNDDGSVQAPDDYYKWVHVGTVAEPDELNPGGVAPFPEFHSVYVEPSAFDYYQKHRVWPNGTQIIKERTLVRDGDNCDEKTGACTEASGIGYFMGGFKGLELSVKDTERFPDEPGGWVYFSFGNEGKPYGKSAKPFPTAECNTCHQNVAESDFVFTQFYPVLR